MNKRLRKKLRRGEFQEFGFQVCFELVPEISAADRDRVWNRFLGEAIEANGLQLGGGGDLALEGFVTCVPGRGSVRDGHRVAVREWLAGHPLVCRVDVGEYADAWNE